ncbi:MAG TPA: hypothetical protein VFR49_00940 [Solirubrobacteraceae bacterium]|nr:hypothetical protein [Solirubrobacteraceae bacterium]
MRPLLAAILLVITALTASSAAAATSTIVADAPGSAGGPTASTASVQAPETATAGPSAASPVQAGQSPILYPAPAPAGPSAVAGDVRAQPTVIAAGSSSAPLGHPSRSATAGGSTGGSTVSRPSPDQLIVSTIHHASPEARPAVAQLSSGGPLVAASGAAAPARVVPPATPRAAMPHHGFAPPAITVPRFVAAPAPVLAVSVPLVGVYMSTATSARHPGEKPSIAPVESFSPSGLPATTITAFGTAPLGQPGGMTALYYGNVPFSSSGGLMAPLIQLSALLAAMTLLAGMSWRRRSWDLPALAGESALLASALDRPG